MLAAKQPVDLLRRGLPLLIPERMTPQYEGQVLVSCREMHAESVLHRGIPLNEDKLMAELRAAADLEHAYFRICVREGEVLGGFFGRISGIYFSDSLYAHDLAFFVKPTYRGSLAAVSLVADFEAWADTRLPGAKGARPIVLGQSTGVKMEATAALYGRLGYEPLGVNTVKRI